jgi:hypothetical protein
MTNGAEIASVLNWVNECYNPTKRGAESGRSNAADVLQIGLIEPAVYPGIKRASGMLCAEVITDVLRLQPDSVSWVDETTTPPTVNVRTQGKWNYTTDPPTFVDYTNLPQVSVNITEEQEKKIIAQGTIWKAPPAVIIWWSGTNQITYNGQNISEPFQVLEFFPAGATLYTPRASLHFVVLAGNQQTIETAQISTEALSDLLSGTQAEQVAWWVAHDRTLADPKIDPTSIVVGAPTVVDASGNDITDTCPPNILKDSHLPKWAANLTPPLTWTKATIRAEIAFTRYADDAKKIPDIKPAIRMIHKTVKLTNATSGTIQALIKATPGEQIPIGIAESVFRSLNQQGYAGTIEFAEAQLRSDLSLGVRLQLVGPNTTFNNILPQRIMQRPCQGVTEVTFGPSPPAAVETLLEVLRATRFRNTWRMPSGRDTGQDASQGQTDTGADAPTEDTAHSPGGNAFDSVLGPTQTLGA